VCRCARPISIDNNCRKMQRCLCNRPSRPIRLWDIEDPAFSRQSSQKWLWVCQPYGPAELYLICVRGWGRHSTILWLEGYNRLIGTVTFGPQLTSLLRALYKLRYTGQYQCRNSSGNIQSQIESQLSEWTCTIVKFQFYIREMLGSNHFQP
jgi:hypothetical protein